MVPNKDKNQKDPLTYVWKNVYNSIIFDFDNWLDKKNVKNVESSDAVPFQIFFTKSKAYFSIFLIKQTPKERILQGTGIEDNIMPNNLLTIKF